MDALTFIAELVKALAWPLTVVVSIALLRPYVAGLAPLLRRLKYGDVELEFTKALEEAKAEAETSLPAEIQEPTPAELRLVKLAEISPRAAILESFTQVEIEAMQAARRIGIPSQYPVTLTYRVMDFLERSGQMDESLVALLRQLRRLRNEAAHSSEFGLSVGAAIEYIGLSRSAIHRLSALTSSVQPSLG